MGHGGHRSTFNGSEGTRANNFNFNFDDLFKQFENDIFGDFGDFKGHYSSHFSAHHQATHGAFSFDDIDDFFNMNDFGNMDMGGGNHMNTERKNTGHQRRGGEARMRASMKSTAKKQHCQTVTQRVNN